VGIDAILCSKDDLRFWATFTLLADLAYGSVEGASDDEYNDEIPDAENAAAGLRFRLLRLLSDGEAFQVISLTPINERFLLFRGSKPESSLPYRTSAQGRVGSAPLLVAIENSDGVAQIALALQQFFWALEGSARQFQDRIVHVLREAISLSPGIELEVAVSGSRVTLYPGGATLLDKAVVNDVLEWLASKPEVAKSFGTALALYQEKDETKFRNLLDNLRFAFEQLLKSVLSNARSLEKQDEPLLTWLGERGAHPQVRAMYRDLVRHFATYQNDAVKHNERWKGPEIEFLIYLTGTFVRLIVQLERMAGGAG
jgi:hypothetical protein